MDDSKIIIEKLERIEQLLNKKPSGGAWIKEVFIPIAGLILATLGFIANNDANKRQGLEEKSAREQKYLEYFLQNYDDKSPSKQAAAFSLLSYLNPGVRKDLIYGLSANIDLSPEAWQVLVSQSDVTLNFSSANNYQVEIYFGNNNTDKANAIKSQLTSAGFKGKIISEEKPPAFWDRFGWGKGNEFRYDPRYDTTAMKYLYRFINAKNPNINLLESPVSDDSRPNSIAVHLPPEHPKGSVSK